MSTLTMDMIRKAAKLVEDLPPVPSEILVGDMKRFIDYAMEKTDIKLENATEMGCSFGAMPVRVSHGVPENMAVIVHGTNVLYIMNFDE